MESPFSVDPPTGILPAGGVTQFTFTFAPPVVKDFHSVLHLILRDVPRPPVVVPLPEEKEGEGAEVAEMVLPPSGKLVLAFNSIVSGIT